MKKIVLLINLVLSLHALAVDGSCFKYLKKFYSLQKKVLPQLATVMEKHLVKDEIDVSDLAKIFERLKQEEKVFNSTYLNRGEHKRNLTETEVQYIRSAFKLDNLSPQEIQDFYTNEIHNLYLFVHHSLLEMFAKNSISKAGLNEEEVFPILVLAYQGLRQHENLTELGMSFEKLSENLNQFNTKQMNLLLKSYQFVKQAKLDEAENLLLESEFSLVRHNLINQFRADRIGVNICCNSPGGCYFCPNNLGLKLKNSQNE